MRRVITTAIVLLVTLLCGAPLAAQPGSSSKTDSPKSGSSQPFLLSPPNRTGPTLVKARFELHDVNEINEGTETFEFTGVLTLTWNDPRQAFDPAAIGANEKIFQGNYQVDEVSTGWTPQVVLVNESGMYQKSGVLLRIKPDGTSTLVQTINAAAESEINMYRFPFDRHRLEAVFEILNFKKDEVVLQVDSDYPGSGAAEVRVPQWVVKEVGVSVRDRPASSNEPRNASSALVVSVNVRRLPFYAMRLVVFPLMVIVLLSFSVFWMDRSSLSDRISVSFIGVLTAVAYLLVTSDHLPRISYVTLMHAFVNISFLTMSATVVINLVVGALDKRGQVERGDRIDRRCRWIFPSIYFGLLLFVLAIGLLFF